MTTLESLYRTVLCDPEDLTARVVLADAIDEFCSHSEPNREWASYIRRAVDLARDPPPSEFEEIGPVLTGVAAAGTHSFSTATGSPRTPVAVEVRVRPWDRAPIEMEPTSSFVGQTVCVRAQHGGAGTEYVYAIRVEGLNPSTGVLGETQFYTLRGVPTASPIARWQNRWALRTELTATLARWEKRWRRSVRCFHCMSDSGGNPGLGADPDCPICGGIGLLDAVGDTPAGRQAARVDWRAGFPDSVTIPSSRGITNLNEWLRKLIGQFPVRRVIAGGFVQTREYGGGDDRPVIYREGMAPRLWRLICDDSSEAIYFRFIEFSSRATANNCLGRALTRYARELCGFVPSKTTDSV